MIAGTIWTQLKTTLKDNPTLSVYIKNVFGGRRYTIEPASLPCIMLEPTRDGEIERDMNQVQNVYFNVDLYAFSSNDFNNLENTIVGNNEYKGILDINNDIRACLSSSYDLGGNVIDIVFEPAVFDELDIGKYPVRGMLLPLKILYRQTNSV